MQMIQRNTSIKIPRMSKELLNEYHRADKEVLVLLGKKFQNTLFFSLLPRLLLVLRLFYAKHSMLR